MSPAGGTAAARRRVARLLALLAVVAGLVLGNGLQCHDGSVPVPGGAVGSHADGHGTDVVGAPAAMPDGEPDPAMLLGACWVLIAVVLSVVVLLGSRRTGVVRATLATGPPPMSLRRPSWGLAQLCVLRT